MTFQFAALENQEDTSSDEEVKETKALFVADVEKKPSHRRRVRIGRTNNVLRTPGRKRTSGKLTYGPKLRRPLGVRGFLKYN